MAITKGNCLYNLGATYQDHQRSNNRRPPSKHDRGYERDRYDRERLHARDRETEHYDLNDEELLNEQMYVGRGGIGYDRDCDRDRERERDRLPPMRGHSATRSSRYHDDEYLHDRSDLRMGAGGSGGRDRYQQLPPHSSSRRVLDRDRDVMLEQDYSPHRTGGSNRRVLNAM